MAFEEVYFDGVLYVSVRRAALLLGKTEKYVITLCERGDLDVKKVGDDWFVSIESVNPRKSDDPADLQESSIPNSKLLPTRSMALFMAVLVGLFVYSSFYGGVGSVGFNKIFSYASSYSEYINNFSVKMVASVKDFDISSRVKERRVSVTNLGGSFYNDARRGLESLESFFISPKVLANVLVDSYVSLLNTTVSLCGDFSVGLVPNIYHITEGFVLSPTRLTIVWTQSYIELNRLAIEYNQKLVHRVALAVTNEMAGPVNDAEKGMLVLSTLREREGSNLSASAINSLGEGFDLIYLNIKVLTKQAGLFFLDLKNTAINNWKSFRDKIFNLRVSEEQTTDIVSSDIVLNDDLIRQQIREEVQNELEAILKGSGVSSQSTKTPFSVSGSKDGITIFPSTGAGETNQDLINRIRNSFSDNVLINLDSSGKAGIIKSNIPGDSSEYIFILTPIRSE